MRELVLCMVTKGEAESELLVWGEGDECSIVMMREKKWFHGEGK